MMDETIEKLLVRVQLTRDTNSEALRSALINLFNNKSVSINLNDWMLGTSGQVLIPIYVDNSKSSDEKITLLWSFIGHKDWYFEIINITKTEY